MPTSIYIRFLTGRAHLHPWHAAPNEGRVEWPPSPWRLLRALVAVAGRGLTTLPEPDRKGALADDWFDAATTTKGKGKKKQVNPDPYWSQHVDALPLSTLAGLLHKLSAPPILWLPRTGVGHTRHFFRVASGRPTKNKPEEWKWEKNTGSAVFDAFAAIDPQQPLVFEWVNGTLEGQDQVHLKTLLSRLPYFGRSESWCEAELKSEALEPGETHWPCVAIEDGVAFKKHFRDQSLREYRDYAIEKRLGWDPSQLEFLKQQLKADAAEEPELLLRALLQLTGESMKHGDRPWGTRWLHYAVPKEIFRLPARRTSGHNRNAKEDLRPRPDFQVIRYAINTATVHRAVLPPLTATLAIAQRCRAAALSIFGRQNGGRCSPQLSGKRFLDEERPYDLFADTDDQVSKFDDTNGSHSAHAYWWPVDEDGDGFLDHLIVLCHDGFSDKDMAALRALNRIKQDGNHPHLLLTPIFEGKWESCPSFLPHWDETPSTNFVSATPYFCPVHLTRRSGKRRSLKDKIIQSLAKSGLPVAARIEEIVFDYDPASLGRRQDGDPRQALITRAQDNVKDAAAEVLVERGGFVVATLNAPLPTAAFDIDPIGYPHPGVRDPDDPCPLGMSRGLFVSNGERFIPALAFHRIRTADDIAKGPGLMLLLKFDSPLPARPFAIGQFCHFGLGLFVPARDA